MAVVDDINACFIVDLEVCCAAAAAAAVAAAAHCCVIIVQAPPSKYGKPGAAMSLRPGMHNMHPICIATISRTPSL